MTTYRLELRCKCPDEVQDDPAFTDDEGLAMMRRGDQICGGCWEYYVLVSARTAEPDEIPGTVG